MFTNWLTGTTGSSSTNSTSTSAALNRAHDMNQNTNGLTTLVNVNGLTNLNTNIISTPPDVVLEVGPGPSTMRFMAHSLVLGMHSGYLRSAIRVDERNSSSSTNGFVGTSQQQHPGDFIVYLSNVTAEQFAPLLSYMYTGYLDLNVENIFGVLLATHVLHMPRALEICRSYLARAQAEGYFGSNSSATSSSNNNNATSNSLSIVGNHQSTLNHSKIIRPIASKPQLPNFGFLPLAHPISALTTLTNRATIVAGNASTSDKKSQHNDLEPNKDEDDDIDVDELDRQSSKNECINIAASSVGDVADDDEDIEVFIDTTSDAEVVVETEIKKLSFKKSLDNNNLSKNKPSAAGHNKARHEKAHKKSHKSDRRRKSNATCSSGLQVAKAPIPASQLDTSEANKVIIDVASCDGPVRFKRILNTAYGHKPENCAKPNHLGMGMGAAGPERSLQSVSLSFHQQMAKTISQQQQHHLHNAEESENSETSNGSGGAGGGGPAGATGSNKSARKLQSEIFVCVYCKHTFKSQYCYQKHAKRHLNPLTLQATCVPATDKRQTSEEIQLAAAATTLAKSANATSNLNESQATIKGLHLPNSSRHLQLRNTPSTSTQSLPVAGPLATNADFLRREVRPLDMNVQYYPCKTCGCKFPSYYFVHKHRKMCHAEEEAAAAQQSSAAGTSTTVAATAAASAIECNEEESKNANQSKD